MTPVWQVQRSSIRQNRGEIIAIAAHGRPLDTRQVLDSWRSDDAFRDLFIAALAASPYPAFFWEMPALSREVLSDPFECAVMGSEALAHLRADDSEFVEHLLAATDSVASFPNLSGDAQLIAPTKISGADCYPHMAAFLREGPRAQQHALFRRIAGEAEEMLAANRRFWISTSGLGVPWVHVRLDSSPKYYQYRRYADA